MHSHRHSVLLVALLALSVGPLAFALTDPEPPRLEGTAGQPISAHAAPGPPERNFVAWAGAHPRALASVPKSAGYSTDVHPLWSSQGCTGCHIADNPSGLDLTGSASVVYPRVNQSPRVNTGDPAASLILTKPQTGTVSHGGGDFPCFSPGSSCYDTILEWIQSGAPFTPCSYSINPSSRAHGAASGTSTVAVSAGSGCAWTATDNRTWISVTAGASGSGNGTVSYSVDANSTTSSRSGNITIADQTFSISQAAASACSYLISPSSRSHSAGGGTGSVDVSAGSGCAWTATESLPWISVTAGASGSGNGTVSYSVGANAATSIRSGNITIAGKTFTVSQDAAPAGGLCVQDATTACLLNGRFRARVRYRGVFDNAPADTNALRKPVTGFSNPNFETVFFYFNSVDNIEILLKMLDQGNTNGQGQPTIAVLFGSATPLRVELTITDTVNGSFRTFTSPFNSQQGATDFIAFVKWTTDFTAFVK